MMPVKADLVICSSLIGVPGWCKNVAFMLSQFLDFSSAGLFQVFANPVTYTYTYVIIYLYTCTICICCVCPCNPKYINNC